MPLADDSSGWAAMARHAIWLERVAGVSVESIGRAALDRKDSFTLEASGRHLAYRLKTDGGWIFVSACPMNTGDSEFLVSMADGKAGWNACSRLILALERSGITKLQPRPLELGEPGSKDCWVIA